EVPRAGTAHVEPGAPRPRVGNRHGQPGHGHRLRHRRLLSRPAWAAGYAEEIGQDFPTGASGLAPARWRRCAYQLGTLPTFRGDMPRARAISFLVAHRISSTDRLSRTFVPIRKLPGSLSFTIILSGCLVSPTKAGDGNRTQLYVL